MADLPFYTGEIAGYEIHMGRTYFSDGKIKNAFRIFERSGEKVIDDGGDGGGGGGAVHGNVIGTYIHGIFDNDAFTIS
jgi:adenosylcobyric acid synthase